MKIFAYATAFLARVKPAILMLALPVLLASYCGPAAAAVPAGRPAIVFFYVDDLNAGELEKAAIKRETTGKFEQKYSPGYSVSFGDIYRKEFVISRFTDLTNLDRFDLLPRLMKDRVDYAVFYSVLPLQSKKDSLFQLVSTTSLVHLRVFDLHKNAYVWDSVFSYTSNWAWLSGHFAKLSDDIDSKVFAVYFPVKQ